MEKRSTFIRDILVKILLIALFLFLLMYLFPMPNLTPFYSAIFNNNIQTMKDAAEDYYTVKRMPTEDGKSVKMTLKEMEDKKLVIPFVDKNGKSCSKTKSYVKVTKDGDEYVLKVSLTCSDESNYIIERIGCHNFCPAGNCNPDTSIADVTKNEETEKKVVCNTDDDGVITVKVPTGKYVKEYEYKKEHKKEDWTIGDWKNNKETESDTVKLYDTRTQYTGQKKVSAHTTLYEQIAYGYKDNWTIGNWQPNKETETSTRKLHDTRTFYTGQKKVTSTTTQYTGQKLATTTTNEYKHIKYGYKDNWTIGEWVNTQEKETDTHKLYSKRTLYTGQKLEVVKTTRYEYAKTKYVLTKDVKSSSTSCTDWKNDTTWRTSKPSNTSTRTWGDSYNSRSNTSWTLVQSSYKSTTVMPSQVNSGGTLYKYELVSKDDHYNCTTNCSSNNIVYYYNVYKQNVKKEYQYKYKDCTTSTSTSTDTKTVYKKADSDNLINQGYRLKSKTVEDKFWSDSATAPANYEATGETGTKTVNKYISLGKWVTNKDKLGEYTYNISTAIQYKYADLTRTKYVIDTKWTKSKTPESGYEYTGETRTQSSTSYVDLGKWVNSKSALGEYTYNIKTRSQSSTSYVDLGKWVSSKSDLGEYTYNIKTRTEYRYKTLTRTKYVKDTIWTTTNVATSGYELTGRTKTTTKDTYLDLGYWVNSKSELKDYTYNIKTRTQYRYKYLNTESSAEYMWSESDPGNGWVATGRSRDKYVQTGYTTETRTVRRNKQK